jgi:hypothetical protein
LAKSLSATQILVFGYPDYFKKESISRLQGDISEVERMLTALDKIIKKTLEPLNP